MFSNGTPVEGLSGNRSRYEAEYIWQYGKNGTMASKHPSKSLNYRCCYEDPLSPTESDRVSTSKGVKEALEPEVLRKHIVARRACIQKNTLAKLLESILSDISEAHSSAGFNVSGLSPTKFVSSLNLARQSGSAVDSKVAGPSTPDVLAANMSQRLLATPQLEKASVSSLQSPRSKPGGFDFDAAGSVSGSYSHSTPTVHYGSHAGGMGKSVSSASVAAFAGNGTGLTPSPSDWTATGAGSGSLSILSTQHGKATYARERASNTNVKGGGGGTLSPSGGDGEYLSKPLSVETPHLPMVSHASWQTLGIPSRSLIGSGNAGTGGSESDLQLFEVETPGSVSSEVSQFQKEDSLVWCHQQIQVARLQECRRNGLADKNGEYPPKMKLFYELVLADANYHPVGTVLPSSQSGCSPDFDFLQPADVFGEILVVMSCAAKVYITELIAIAQATEQAETRQFTARKKVKIQNKYPSLFQVPQESMHFKSKPAGIGMDDLIPGDRIILQRHISEAAHRMKLID